MRVIGVGILLLAYIVEYVTAVDHSTQFWTSMQFVNDSWYWVENTIYTPVTDSRWELIPNTNFETFALVKSPGKWKADIESASASAVCEGPSGPDATAITIPATTPDYSTQPPVTPACAARTSGPAVYEDLENERCYYAWNIPWPRSNQETICLIDDAYLVTLESDVEKTCLDAWLQAIGHTYEYWLGMEYITDKWYWHVHNTTLVEVTTNHWDFPPNTTVDKYGYGTPAGKWTGDPGEFYANAVCERLPKNVTGTVNAPTTAITPMIPAGKQSMNRLYYILIAFAIFAVLAFAGIMVARYYKRRGIYIKLGQKSATPLEDVPLSGDTTPQHFATTEPLKIANAISVIITFCITF